MIATAYTFSMCKKTNNKGSTYWENKWYETACPLCDCLHTEFMIRCLFGFRFHPLRFIYYRGLFDFLREYSLCLKLWCCQQREMDWKIKIRTPLNKILYHTNIRKEKVSSPVEQESLLYTAQTAHCYGLVIHLELQIPYLHFVT